MAEACMFSKLFSCYGKKLCGLPCTGIYLVDDYLVRSPKGICKLFEQGLCARICVAHKVYDNLVSLVEIPESLQGAFYGSWMVAIVIYKNNVLAAGCFCAANNFAAPLSALKIQKAFPYVALRFGEA